MTPSARASLARHTLAGIELAPRIVTAEQYERDARLPVFVTDDTVAILADGITVTRTDATGRARTWVLPGLGIAPWLQRTMGLRIREALGVRKADFKTRSDGTRYLHLCWQASRNGRELEPLKHRKAGDFRDVPVPDLIWDMIQPLPDGPLCPGPHGTPYLPYGTASSRFGRHPGPPRRSAACTPTACATSSPAKHSTPTPANSPTSPRSSATTASRPRCGSTSTPAPTPNSASAR